MKLVEELTTNKMVSIERNDSLVGLVKSRLQNISRIKRPEDYFYLTELVNPSQAYWDRKEWIEFPKKIQLKMALGTKLHRLAGFWFKDLDGFDYPEAILDGAWVGIDGVRGKIDFRYGNSILEIKSKSDPIEDYETIIYKYPHDLEQLLFYASISTIPNDIHYLVFIHDESPHPITVFKVKIKDIEPFKNLLRQRIKMLRTALVNNDPTLLGRCRYYRECQYSANEKCNCKNLDPIDTSLIIEHTEIERDKNFESILIKKRKGSNARSLETLNPFQLIYPRKWYKEQILGLKSSWRKSALDEAWGAMLWKAIHDIGITNISKSEELESRKTNPIPIIFPSNYIRYFESGVNSTVVPYIHTVSRSSNPLRPHKIPLARLAVTCGLTNSSKGVIFVAYRVIGIIVAYVATFKDIKSINSLIDNQVRIIQKALETENPSLLPPCEGFMQTDCGEGCLCKDQQINTRSI